VVFLGPGSVRQDVKLRVGGVLLETGNKKGKEPYDSPKTEGGKGKVKDG